MNDDVKNWIPKPCHLKWDDLNEDQRMAEGHIARNCDECEHHVHDLTAMSAEQILKLQTDTAATGKRLCGMLREAPSSELDTQKNQPSGHLRSLKRISLASLAPIALASCADTAPTPPTHQPEQVEIKPEKPSRFKPGMVGLIAPAKQ